MARGHWRNWEETNCKGCGSLIYKKYGKKNKGEFYCVSCWERIKTHKGWHENPDNSGKAPRHSEAATKIKFVTTLRTPVSPVITLTPDNYQYYRNKYPYAFYFFSMIGSTRKYGFKTYLDAMNDWLNRNNYNNETQFQSVNSEYKESVLQRENDDFMKFMEYNG